VKNAQVEWPGEQPPPSFNHHQQFSAFHLQSRCLTHIKTGVIQGGVIWSRWFLQIDVGSLSRERAGCPVSPSSFLPVVPRFIGLLVPQFITLLHQPCFAAAEMRFSLPATRALVAVTGLLGLVDAQGTFSTAQAEVEQCGNEGFVYLGCYDAPIATALATLFTFIPTEYGYSTPFNTENSFPGFSIATTNIFDNSHTPLNCARVCRGYGFKYTVVGAATCYCGTQIPLAGPPGVETPGGCTLPCPGDSSQTCGGTVTAASALVKFYYDPSFADYTTLPGSTIAPPAAPNPEIARAYRYLGCYRVSSDPLGTAAAGTVFVPIDSRYTTPTIPNGEACFSICAGLGYPLAAAVRSPPG
jgi:hypothetical protein